MTTKTKTDSGLDLVFERLIDVPREKVWAAWTQAERLKKWFCPAPWKTVEAEIDLRPGGAFRTVMQSPEGQRFPSEGCYLEVVENERLVWTSALRRGYRPADMGDAKKECDEIAMTCILTLEDAENGTKYVARVLHAHEAGRRKHEEMGFHDGWGKAFEQLVAMIKENK